MYIIIYIYAHYNIYSKQQGRRKLPRGGAADRLECDAAGGSEKEARSADQSARSAEKNFRLHFQLSGWALVALS